MVERIIFTCLGVEMNSSRFTSSSNNDKVEAKRRLGCHALCIAANLTSSWELLANIAVNKNDKLK